METQTQAKPQSQVVAVTVSGDPKVKTIRDLLIKSKDQIQMALPRHMTAERMLRIALTAIQRTPKLLECHPITLVGAIIQAAQLGLEPDGVAGHAYLVPFWNKNKNRFEAQFIPGYRGLIDLSRRSQEVVGIEARVVHAKDKFKFSFGLNPVLEHEPSILPDPGIPIYFYAVARLKGGLTQFDVMTATDVDKIRARSKAKDSGPWVTDYEEMGKKTVIRRLSKLLPVSIELHRAVALDEKAELGIPQDLGLLADESETGTELEQKPEAVPEPKRISEAVQEVVQNPETENSKNDGDVVHVDVHELPAMPKPQPVKLETGIAKVSTLCGSCKDPIAKGDDMLFDRAKKQGYHPGCAPQ